MVIGTYTKMKSKILITGASGFIGSHFLEHVLTNTNWDVTCIASWKHKGEPERILEVLRGNRNWKKRVRVITHDLEMPFTEKTKTQIAYNDYMVNFASESHVDRSIETPVPFIQNNVNVVLTMLELAREKKPKKFVQISTDEVYGAAPDGINHTEWSSIIPSNPYSASKACQEAIAISYWRTYDVPLIITNTMNNFGEMQDSEKYMARAIRMIQKGETLTVHGRKGDIGSRYYLHARDHADAVLFLLKAKIPAKYKYGEVMQPDRYNVVGNVELNNLEVGQKIAIFLKKRLKYKLTDFHKTRPGHDRRYALDGGKMEKLGWYAPYGFDESLKKYINWTLKHPNWL